ncbi:protein FAM161B-like isoform X1 [Petromyzon marinus]|uniref:protein FAM161B-like isoform X1 n=1 Tax=Petromyzon marinus TaxID=7757 RepID=UPI003F71A97C
MSSPHALSALLAGARARPRVAPAAAAVADTERESGSDSGLEDAPPRRPASLPSTRVCPVPTTTAAPVSDPARLRGFAEQADERVGERTGGEQLEVLYREAVKRAQEQRPMSPETPREDEGSSPEPSAKATPAAWSDRTWDADNRRGAVSKPPLPSSAGRLHTGTSSSGMRVSSHSKPWRSLLDLGSWDDSEVDTPPAVRRVLQLWQGFRLDDYAAFHGRPEPRPKPRSASCARSPKVTIPKPFSLVQREVEREAARGTRRRRLAEELARLALERRQREEAECAVRVRAAPVPARSLLPLYHELRERAQRRSHDNRAARKEELRASLKPFEFAEREENKRELRVCPRHDLEKEVSSKSRRAGSAERPALRAVLDPSVSERLAADELLRRVRAGMRAQELLEKAAIPPGLHAHIAQQARGEQREGRSRTAPVATRCSEPSFRPRVHHSVPDFQRLLRDFQRSSLSRSAPPPPPVACAPFALRTTQRGEKRAAAATASAGRDARPRAFRSSPCPPAADWIPTRSNDAARRRHESIRSRALEGRERKERDEEERAKTRRERERAMRADLLRRARANDPHRSLAESHPGKLRQVKEQDKKRTNEYNTELQAMKARVARRPLLLEQVTQRNAKRQAERRFREALQETGMDEEFVRELGSGAAGGETPGPADEDDDDDDDGASDTGMTGGVPDSIGRGDSQDSRPLQNSRGDESEDVKGSQESDEGDLEEHREEGDKEDASEGEDDVDERQ